MGAAIWIHALGAVPWVAFIVGIGLTWIEPELEDEATLIVGPWRVLFLVTLPRARASILAAGLFVILQTAAEVGVTEMTLVPTLAEETRRQFALADSNGLERTLALSLPGLALTGAAVLVGLAYLGRRLPPLTPPTHLQRPLTPGPAWLRGVTRRVDRVAPSCAALQLDLEARPVRLSEPLEFLDRLAFLANGNTLAWH